MPKEAWLVVNKAEGLDQDIVSAASSTRLGLGRSGRRVRGARRSRFAALMDAVLEDFAETRRFDDVEEDDDHRQLRIAVVGRPECRQVDTRESAAGRRAGLVVYDQPGTTRDSVAVPFERERSQSYLLIDTAGIRRKARVHEAIEKFSIIKALQAIEQAQVVLAVIDAHEGVTEQDVSLLGLIVERGRALVVAVNKWDGMSSDERHKVRDDLERRLPFLDFAERINISALHGTAVGDLLPAAGRAVEAALRDMPTTALTNELEAAVTAHPPPLVRGRRIRLRYAHQGGRNPPVIVIHGNQTERLPEAYRRYLVNRFRKAFRLKGTPVRLSFKTSDNPYKGRRNKLTPRQQRRRKRLMKHHKK